MLTCCFSRCIHLELATVFKVYFMLALTYFHVTVERYTLLFYIRIHLLRTSKLRLDKKIRINEEQSEARITFSKK